MLYSSLNKKSPKVNFEQALLQGLAPDGGLYYPESISVFTLEEIERLKQSSLHEVGYQVLRKWIGEELEDATLRAASTNALDFPIPIKKVGPYHILELFHGPSLAFKDVAAKWLAQLLGFFLREREKKATLLVATSGDTGSAVAQSFSGFDNIKVVILYPKGRVSLLQEELLTRVAENVLPVEVEGRFDDCQALVKKALIDPDLASLHLTSANSINIGRLIPQLIYYVHAYAQLAADNLEFVVPSGNMGNVTAGFLAQGMGLPFSSFIIACNVNDPVVQYYSTGVYKPKHAVQTLSNAMDIGNPSNFVRILEYFRHDHSAFIESAKAVSTDDTETSKTIRSVYKKHGYLLDPHTAVGWSAAQRIGRKNAQQVILATASPVKFSPEIKKETGISVDDREVFRRLEKLTKRKVEMKSEISALKHLLINNLEHCSERLSKPS